MVDDHIFDMANHPFELSSTRGYSLGSKDVKRWVGSIEFDRDGRLCFEPKGSHVLLSLEELRELVLLMGTLPHDFTCPRCNKSNHTSILRKHTSE